MAVMDVVHVERPFTVDDLEETPDDGYRYELIDGVLLVNPAPGWRHGEASLTLALTLRQAAPEDVRVMHAPFGVQPDKSNEVQPDVLVGRWADMREKHLPVAPLLAVEVISPSSRLTDPSLKKAFYERLGVRSYWLVDPDLDEPSLTVFTLNDEGTYKETARVVGDEPYEADEPFPVTVVPTALVAGARPKSKE